MQLFLSKHHLISIFFCLPRIVLVYTKAKSLFAAKANLNYSLEIEWNGKSYNATSKLSEVAPIPTFFFHDLAHPDSVLIGDFVTIFNPNQQAMYQVNVDWSDMSPQTPNQAELYFYTFSTVHISEFIRPPKETLHIPRGSTIYIKKFGLNNDFAEFLRSKAIETEWNGSYLYSTAENLPTNISSDALGFFSTCAVLRDTILVE